MYRHGLKLTTLFVPSRQRWREGVFLIPGCFLLAGALALGGGSDLLRWVWYELLHSLLPILALIALYLFPGLALLRLLWTQERPHYLPLAAYLTLATGLSVALAPLMLLLFHLLHLPWNRAVLWGYVLVSAGIAFCPMLMKNNGQRVITAPAWLAVRPMWTDALLLAGTLAALVVNLYIFRDLPTGLFGDSYHHSVITQLLVNHQGLFQSWQPFAPLVSFTYHFGFHANAAFVHWASGRNVVQSVLITGQILNALSVPMAFLLVGSLRGTAWAGLWAAVLTGFVSTLPSFYVNWGRYTQLTGHIVLVVAVVCWVVLFDSPTMNHFLASGKRRTPLSLVKRAALAGTSTAALVLSHYLVTIMAAVFVGSFLLVWFLARRSLQGLGKIIALALLATMVALLISTPWLLNVLNGYLVRIAAGFVQGRVDAGVTAQFTSIPQIVPLYAKNYVLYAALLGVCLAAWTRSWRMALPAVWSLLLGFCVVPHALGLPGAGIVDHLTGFGALYITYPTSGLHA